MGAVVDSGPAAAAGPGADDLLDLFLRLLEIPSPSGQERAVADFALDYLRSAGLEPHEDDSVSTTGAGSGNIVVRLAGRGRGTPVLIGAHLDTVAADGRVVPVVEDGVVRSQGETILGADNKCACAILLMLLRDLAGEPPGCGVEAVFSTSEEIGLRGAKALDLDESAARAGFVFDSSGAIGEVITSAPAQKTIVAEFHGVAAHAGIAPEDGRSAILAASRAVAAMDLGRVDEATTANVGTIHGGTATNIIPERCRMEAEARSRDLQLLAEQVTHMLDAITEGATLAGVDVTTSVIDEYSAFALDEGALPVRIAAAAMRALGVEPRIAATGGGSDVNVYNAKGLPSVNLSVGMEKVHTHDEYMPVARLHEAYRLIHELVKAAAAIT